MGFPKSTEKHLCRVLFSKLEDTVIRLLLTIFKKGGEVYSWLPYYNLHPFFEYFI